MSNVIYPKQFHSRVTSASKPDYIHATSARARTLILLSLGWERDASDNRVFFSHPDFYEGTWIYLDMAWQSQLLRALCEREVS